MRFIKEKTPYLLLLVIIVAMAWLRLTTYGKLSLSVGTPDTPGYVNASRAPLFSMEMFTGRRLFSTNILFKLANNESTCPDPKVSIPGAGQENDRTDEQCFDAIVLLQNILAVTGWSALAWVVARRLRQFVFKLLAATIILGFAYTPQIAEWDSILSPESLSLSLFALLFALLLEICIRIADGQALSSPGTTIWLITFALLVFFYWIFLRDVHIYSAFMLVGLAIPFLFYKNIRAIRVVIPLLIILFALFLFGSTTAHLSPRWQPSISHSFDTYILPSQTAVEFMTSRGMPDPQSGEPYESWFNANADRSYALFLVTHPGFIVTNLINAQEYFSDSFFQPYYRPVESQTREYLSLLGEFLHPTTNAVFILDALLLAGMLIAAIKHRDAHHTAWAWVAVWAFLFAAVSLFTGFFGDTYGTRRHIFPSVELFRLYTWMFLFVVMDWASG